MSRSGKRPIPLPKGVEVRSDSAKVTVKGPKGSLEADLYPGITIEVRDDGINVLAEDEGKISRFHGLVRALINNMVTGVTKGFEKKLEMVGVGYRAAVKGESLEVQIGCSHPTAIRIPKGVSVAVEKNTAISVSGIDRQRVGQFAADLRSMKPPEPYKGKGIRYEGEYVRRKAGKTAK